MYKLYHDRVRLFHFTCKLYRDRMRHWLFGFRLRFRLIYPDSDYDSDWRTKILLFTLKIIVEIEICSRRDPVRSRKRAIPCINKSISHILPNIIPKMRLYIAFRSRTYIHRQAAGRPLQLIPAQARAAANHDRRPAWSNPGIRLVCCARH